jgi:transposase
MESENQPQRSRRKHSPEFKAEVIQACSQAGVSIRSVALSRGVDPSLVRHWLSLHAASMGAGAAAVKSAPILPRMAAQAAGSFLAVRVDDRHRAAAAIRLELRRGPAIVTVDWPAQEAAACGAWLREWLR